MANLESDDVCPMCGRCGKYSPAEQEKRSAFDTVGRFFAQTVAAAVILGLGASLALGAIFVLQYAWGLVF